MTAPGSQWTREIPCEDSFGRPSVMVVAVTEGGKVAFHAPAGETAVMGPAQLQLMQETVHKARSEAAHQAADPRPS